MKYSMLIYLYFERHWIFWCCFHVIDLGLRQPRLEGEEYLSIVDEFMEAVHARWPKAIVQVCFFVLFFLFFFPW